MLHHFIRQAQAKPKILGLVVCGQNPNFSPQRQEYCTLGIPINAENNKHVRGCYESPCPCHHQHFADEIPRIPLK